MDNVRQRQSIKDCLVYPSIANIQNPIIQGKTIYDIPIAKQGDIPLYIQLRSERSCV